MIKEDLIIISNKWWKRPLCWFQGGHTVTPYDYADNGWLFCHRCGKNTDNRIDEIKNIDPSRYITND